MKSTTAGFKTIMNSGNARRYKIKIDLTLADNTTKHLTEADIWEDSFSIDTASSGTSSFDLGCAVIGKCTFTINNIEGDFNNLDFFNAEATVWLGLEGDLVNNVQQYYRMGFYTVDEPQIANGLISLTLLDNMWKFDVPLSEAGITFTSSSTCRSIVNAMCSHCGVTLATQSFHGYDFPLTQGPDNADDMNCRELLQYIAMIGCNFCVINSAGTLELKWYDVSATASTTDVFDLNQSTSFGASDIQVTGVKIIIENTEYKRGTDGYVLEIENPLLNADNAYSALNLIWSNGYLKDFTFRTFNLTTASDLAAEIGDKCKIKDYKGNYIYSYITMNSFKLAGHLLQCNAISPARTLIKRYSKAVQTAVEEARGISKELISTHDQSVQRLNKLVEQSMGAFEEYEEAPNGGRIYYISNMPITKSASGVCSFEQGSVVFRMAGDVFSVSNDGGITWRDGYDPTTGELVINVLNAIGINAEWINTGTLTVGGSTSGTQHPTIEVFDASDNLICEINRNGITMHRGIISSPDYAEETGSTYSTTGMKLDVLNKIMKSPYFAIYPNGAFFKGEILITGDLEIGTNSCNFIPKEYNIADYFDLKLQAPEGFTGSIHYRLVHTNGSHTSFDTEGDITDDAPVMIYNLDPLLNSNYWYEITIGSGSTIKVSIPEAVFAYVGKDGFKGQYQGIFRGSLDVDNGRIGNMYFGVTEDGKHLSQGVLSRKDEYSGNYHVLDFSNGDFKIQDKPGNEAGAEIIARLGLSEEGAVFVTGEGTSDDVVFRVSSSSCDIAVVNDSNGGTLIRSYPNPEQQGTYIEEEVLWDDGDLMKYSEVETSTSDSPPVSLADGHLFLVYE